MNITAENTTPTVYIFVGLPFAGKTTFSRLLSERLAIPRVSFDDEWAKYTESQTTIPGNNSIEQWRYINTYCENQVAKHLNNGISVVYDNMNNHIEHRERVTQMAKAQGAKSQIIFIDVPIKEVLKRRKENSITLLRHQVSDENFNNAITNLEKPTASENPIIIKNVSDFELLLNQKGD